MVLSDEGREGRQAIAFVDTRDFDEFWTVDQEIGGVSQHQGSQGSLTLTSQYGTLNVSSLSIVSLDGSPGDAPGRRRPPASPKLEPDRGETAQQVDMFAKIERLAKLQQRGIVSLEEFVAKKAELLSRLRAHADVRKALESIRQHDGVSATAARLS